MKLEKLSAAAELISSVAIVVTLGYLAIETNQNTRATQASIRQAMLVEDRELLFKEIDYPHLHPETYGLRDLTPDQELQIQAFMTTFLRIREHHWLQFQAGVIDEETWSSYRYPIRVFLATDWAKQQWRSRADSGEFVQGFIDDVNSLLFEE